MARDFSNVPNSCNASDVLHNYKKVQDELKLAFSKVPPPDTRPPVENSRIPMERTRTNTWSNMSQRSSLKAKVMFDYKATEDDEITLLEGDIVEIISMDTDQYGLWLIKKGIHEGFVPGMFLEKLGTEKPPPPEPEVLENSKTNLPAVTAPVTAPTKRIGPATRPKPTKLTKPLPQATTRPQPPAGGTSKTTGTGTLPLTTLPKVPPPDTRPPVENSRIQMERTHTNTWSNMSQRSSLTAKVPPPDTRSPVENSRIPMERTRTNTWSNMSQRSSLKAKVMFDYKATEDDEITLLEGDIVEIISMDTDQYGLWLIKKGIHEGFVPGMFLEKLGIEKPPPPEPEVLENSKTNLPAVTAPVTAPTKRIGPATRPKPTKLTKPLPQATTRPQPPAGGTSKTTGTGTLPLTTLPKVPPPDTRPPVENSRIPMERTRTNTWSNMSQRSSLKAKVMFDYKATEDDEITLLEGDIVEIISMDTDQYGLWLIKKGIHEGFVPGMFLEKLGTEKPSPPEPEVLENSKTNLPAVTAPVTAPTKRIGPATRPKPTKLTKPLPQATIRPQPPAGGTSKTTGTGTLPLTTLPKVPPPDTRPPVENSRIPMERTRTNTWSNMSQRSSLTAKVPPPDTRSPVENSRIPMERTRTNTWSNMSQRSSLTAKVPPPDTRSPVENYRIPMERTRTNTWSNMSQRSSLKAKVMFDYKATEDDEITLLEGDIVEIISMDTDQYGLWLIKKGIHEGFVPGMFLEKLGTEKPPPPEPKVLENPPLPPKVVEAPRPNPVIPKGKVALPKLPDKVDTDKPVDIPPCDPTYELDVPPHNGLLDNSKVRQRPRKSPINRPPSKSNMSKTNLPAVTAPVTAPTKRIGPATRPKPTKLTKPLPQATTRSQPPAGGTSKTTGTGTLPLTTLPKVPPPDTRPPVENSRIPMERTRTNTWSNMSQRSSLTAKVPPPDTRSPVENSRIPMERTRTNTWSNMSQRSSLKAKVMFDYKATEDVEITLLEGDIVEIISMDTDQYGLWLIKKGIHEGFVPGMFLEKLGTEKPPPPEPKVLENPPLPPKVVEAPRPNPVIPKGKVALPKLPDKVDTDKPVDIPPCDPTDELDVPPHNGLLDNSKVRQRPRKSPINRPPSKSNMFDKDTKGPPINEKTQEDNTESSSGAPWQQETKTRKSKTNLPAVTAPVTAPTKGIVPTTRPKPPVRPKPTRLTKPLPQATTKSQPPAGGTSKTTGTGTLPLTTLPKVPPPDTRLPIENSRIPMERTRTNTWSNMSQRSSLMAKVPPPNTRPPVENSRIPMEQTRTNTWSNMSQRSSLTAKVMFDYKATQVDEITVLEGDIVEIISMDTYQDGWWLIKKGIHEGFVPDNFLEKLCTEKRGFSLGSFKKQFDDQLTCSVCLDQYTNPKTLPCHQSFCLKCIQQLTVKMKAGNYYISCPTCRVDHLVPEGGVTNLPNAFQINSLLDLCQRLSDTPTESNSAITCPKHNDILKVYCETCCHFICRDCTISKEHKTHDFYLISECYPKHHQQIEANLDQVKHKKAEINAAVIQLDITEKKVIEKGEELQKQINTHAQQIIDQVERSREQLSQQLHNIVKQKTQSLAAQKQQAQRLHTQLNTCQEMIDHSLKEWTQLQILTGKHTMINQMDTATQHVDPTVFQPIENADMKFEKAAANTFTKKEIGFVKSNVYNKATLSIVKILPLRKSTATLTLQSQDDSPFSLPPSLISSTLSSPDDSHSVKCDITQKNEAGKYNITFTPSIRQDELIVQVGGVDISDSPFTFHDKTWLHSKPQ